ncbi:ankyrin repeat-containing domain protein [Trichoderma evansii]
MDPLLITTSIIIATAAKLSKGLHSLYELRHAPKEILELLNEVSLSSAPLLTLPYEDRTTLEKLLKSVQEPLDELTSLVAACTGNPTPSRLETTTAWLKPRRKVENIKTRFSRAHRNINTALTALGNIHRQQDNQVILDIYDLVLHQTKESVVLKQIEQQFSLLSAEPEKAILILLEKEYLAPTSHCTNNCPPSTFASIRASIRTGSCDRHCRCQCHVRTNMESSRWLGQVLGILFWTYTGTPTPMTRLCDAAEAFALIMSYGSLSGLCGSWSISFPRAISASHKVWQHIERHECEELVKLLRTRSIYGNDLADDDGTSLLIYTLKFRSHDAVELLLEYGASLDLVDPRGILIRDSSARAYGQSSLLIDRPKRRLAWSARIEFNSDEPGFINDLHFTPLHYIITGLETADLDQQLRPNRPYLDTPDSFGRSLNGASPDRVDKEQMIPLHDMFLCPSSSQVQCGRLLLDAGANVDSLDAWKRTPLRIIIGYCSANQDFLRLLFERGADINCSDTYGQSPLLKSIQGALETTQLLLSHGADTEAKDIYGNTPILEAIYCDKPEKVRMLLEHSAKMTEPFELKPGPRARDGPIHFLDFVLWYGNIEVMQIVEEIVLANSYCRLCYPTDKFDDSQKIRRENGRKLGKEEFETFSRILSNLQPQMDRQDTEAEAFFDAHDCAADGALCCI